MDDPKQMISMWKLVWTNLLWMWGFIGCILSSSILLLFLLGNVRITLMGNEQTKKKNKNSSNVKPLSIRWANLMHLTLLNSSTAFSDRFQWLLIIWITTQCTCNRLVFRVTIVFCEKFRYKIGNIIWSLWTLFNVDIFLSFIFVVWILELH